MTYRQLLEKLESLTPEQLDQKVHVEIDGLTGRINHLQTLEYRMYCLPESASTELKIEACGVDFWLEAGQVILSEELIEE